MKELYPSFADPEKWRCNRRGRIMEEGWRRLRREILERDAYACGYCAFAARKWQIVHHINGDPEDNRRKNLETVCPMCNLVMHSGQGCAIQGVVDLYRSSAFSQVEIIRITREMRGAGEKDQGIIEALGLRHKVPFRMDRKYLRGLFAFVSSRDSAQEWTKKALVYGYRQARVRKRNRGAGPSTGAEPAGAPEQEQLKGNSRICDFL